MDLDDLLEEFKDDKKQQQNLTTTNEWGTYAETPAKKAVIP